MTVAEPAARMVFIAREGLVCPDFDTQLLDIAHSPVTSSSGRLPQLRAATAALCRPGHMSCYRRMAPRRLPTARGHATAGIGPSPPNADRRAARLCYGNIRYVRRTCLQFDGCDGPTRHR